MKFSIRSHRPLLALVMVAMATPALAQSAPDANAEARMRKLEAEVRALQRQVFPGGDAKIFPAQVQAPQAAPATIGTPATTPVTDLLARMDAVETQIARLTAQSEEYGNRLAKLEAQMTAEKAAEAKAAEAAAAVATPAAITATDSPDANLAAMTGGASAPKPAAAAPALVAAPSAARLAAVKAIVKPQTGDPGDDDYSYGFRLWDAKFYPEAEQQLKLFLQKYPKHPRTSYARNLLGRAYLDDGNPREAAKWFLENYQTDKTGARASDSLLYLALAMKQLNDTNRACIALAQFAEEYASDAAGRLRGDYDSTRAGLKCSK